MRAAALTTILTLCPTMGHADADGPRSRPSRAGGPAKKALRVSLAPLERVNISEQEGVRYRRVLERVVRVTHGLELHTPADEPCDLREVSCLHQLRSTLGADRLLVLRVGHLGDTTVIRLTVHDLNRAVRQGSWQEVLRGQTDHDAVAAALKRMVAGFAPPPPPPPPPSPWYKKWWVWTAAGVVVAGGVTAAVLATRGGDGPDHTIVPP